MRELKKRLAKILIERSYREGDFTLASGRKSDYYFDCRQTALHPEGSWLIGTLFNELLADLDIIISFSIVPLSFPHNLYTRLAIAFSIQRIAASVTPSVPA